MALHILDRSCSVTGPNAENQCHTGPNIWLHTLKGRQKRRDTNTTSDPKLFFSLAVNLRQEPPHCAANAKLITNFNCGDKIIGPIPSGTNDKTPGHFISASNGKRMGFSTQALVRQHRELSRLKLWHRFFRAECDIHTTVKWDDALNLNQTCWNQFTQQRLAPCDDTHDRHTRHQCPRGSAHGQRAGDKKGMKSRQEE